MLKNLFISIIWNKNKEKINILSNKKEKEGINDEVFWVVGI